MTNVALPDGLPLIEKEGHKVECHNMCWEQHIFFWCIRKRRLLPTAQEYVYNNIMQHLYLAI